jgi:hypothetical protein
MSTSPEHIFQALESPETAHEIAKKLKNFTSIPSFSLFFSRKIYFSLILIFSNMFGDEIF